MLAPHSYPIALLLSLPLSLSLFLPLSLALSLTHSRSPTLSLRLSTRLSNVSLTPFRRRCATVANVYRSKQTYSLGLLSVRVALSSPHTRIASIDKDITFFSVSAQDYSRSESALLGAGIRVPEVGDSIHRAALVARAGHRRAANMSRTHQAPSDTHTHSHTHTVGHLANHCNRHRFGEPGITRHMPRNTRTI